MARLVGALPDLAEDVLVQHALVEQPIDRLDRDGQTGTACRPSERSYDGPNILRAAVLPGQFRPLDQEQIGNVPNHPAGERQMLHVRDAVHPDDLRAHELAQKATHAAGGRPRAQDHVRPLATKNRQALEEHLDHLQAVLSVAFPHHVHPSQASEILAHRFRRGDHQSVIFLNRLHDLEQLTQMPAGGGDQADLHSSILLSHSRSRRPSQNASGPPTIGRWQKRSPQIARPSSVQICSQLSLRPRSDRPAVS